ncbi:hypothetical protein [uncultured Mediterranean phage]|nr:hypothetical protein [uncultured Mediterranean phage]
MPLISKGMYNQNFGQSNDTTSEFRNPNSIWRNTVRIKPNEYAVVRFITDYNNGDMSQYHAIPGITAKGQQFTTYEYCSKVNKNESGPILDIPCEHCPSADEKIARTTSRYLTWVFHYGTLHVEQNPFLDREGQEAWEQISEGNNTYFREVVKKPQLLNTSWTLFRNITDKYDRYSTLLDRTFDYRSTRPSTITQYNIEVSDQKLQNPYAQEILDMSNSLPDLELIAAKLITELDLPDFAVSPEQAEELEASKQQEDDAFANMANMSQESF